MRANQYIRIVVVLGMAAVMCWAVHAAGVGVIAETHVTSGAEAPACPPTYQCMAESDAIKAWGLDGYEKEETKTICGQSADAMVQYYCIRQISAPAATSAPAVVVTTAAGTAAPAAPAAAGVTQKSPVGTVSILAGIGIALLAAAAMRRK
jgi:hypothetical protein